MFDDGHDTGLYTWAYLYELGRDRDAEVAAATWTGCRNWALPIRPSAEETGAVRRAASLALDTGRTARLECVVTPATTMTATTPTPPTAPPTSATSKSRSREKPARVRAVFDSVAGNYDLMNDLMSAGTHRLWKRFTLSQTGLRPGQRALDVAGGTGDLAAGMAQAGRRRRAGRADRHQCGDARGRSRRADRSRHRRATSATRSPMPSACRSRTAASIA